MDFSAVEAIIIGTFAAVLMVWGLDGRERRLAMAAFGLHVVGSFTEWAIIEFYYGINDAHNYRESGIQLAKLMSLDSERAVSELVNLFLHRETHLPFEVFGDGLSNGSGTMSALAGIFIYFLGPSILTMNLLTSWIAWFGQVCLYRVARDELPEGDRTAALVGFLFVPSVIFWGSAFCKEAFVLGFLGVVTLSAYRVWRNRKVMYLIGMIVGAVGVAMIKPYTLFAYVVGVGAFIYAHRAWRTGPIRIRISSLLLASAISLGGVAVMGSFFPEFGAGKVAETIAANQEGWGSIEGGSNVEIGSGEAKTISQQLQFAPLALVNALFRPAIFEARNGPMLGAAFETTLVALGVLSLLRSKVRRIARESVMRSPFLVFSVVFATIFAVAVGLGTSNLGSLSRYRVPMMPFYVTIVLVLRRRGRKPLKNSQRSALHCARINHSRYDVTHEASPC